MVADQPVESRDLAAVAQQEDGGDAHDAVSRNGVCVSVDIDPVASEVVAWVVPKRSRRGSRAQRGAQLACQKSRRRSPAAVVPSSRVLPSMMGKLLTEHS